MLFTIQACALSVYAIVYTMSYNAVLEDIESRSRIVNEYALNVIDTDSFTNINGIDDETKQEYLTMQTELNRIREIANVQYLYTAKENERGELIYVIDGLCPGGPDFRHAGSLIEEELWKDLRLCLQGEIVSGKDIYHTQWGNVYVTYWPVRNAQGAVVGAIGMEFNMDVTYQAYREIRIWSIILSAALILLFSLIARIPLKRVSEPFYKKLAYTDILTGLQNRMAFEEHLKECKKYLSEGISVSLVVFDLNNLKAINDSMGHKQGDDYIRNSAMHIDRSLKEMGMTYRIGGDELATVVVDCPQENIQNALLELYKEEKMVLKNLPFDCAYGLASFDPAADRGLHDVFNRADDRMYMEKKRQKEEKAK